MTKMEQNQLIQSFGIMLDARFSDFETKMDSKIDAKLYARLGKNNEKVKDFVETTGGRYIGMAFEHLDDNFRIIAENFKTVNDRFDRLITILEKKEVIEEGLF